jgi:hypothetical protein
MVHWIDKQAEKFRDSLRSIDNERGKSLSCLMMRNKLLIVIKELFASMEKVMLKECAQYEKAKSCWPKRGSLHTDPEQWDLILDPASSGARSTLYKEQLSPMSETAESQLLSEIHNAAENSGCGDIISLMYEALTSLQFKDQNLTRHMAQLSQQYESLQMQLEMECNETSTQSIKSQLQDLDKEWLERHEERRNLKKEFKRECVVYFRDTNV